MSLLCAPVHGVRELLHPARLRGMRGREQVYSAAPLTLDELREMDDEPVWCCDMDGTHGRWMLVDADYCGNMYEVSLYSEYGKTWLAYRRRPEEV